jgi:hypothetical protein
VLTIWMNGVHESFAQPSKKGLVLQIIVALAKVKIGYFNIEPIEILFLINAHFSKQLVKGFTFSCFG